MKRSWDALILCVLLFVLKMHDFRGELTDVLAEMNTVGIALTEPPAVA